MRTIALDATGGDHAPFEIVRAAAELSLEGSVRCRLIGDAARLARLLLGHRHDPAHLALADVAASPASAAPAVPAPHPGAGDAIRLAADLVARGDADAAVSAGDTRACVATWLDAFPLLPGVSRPALAAFFPHRPAEPAGATLGLILDVGATLRCHPRDYANLALMGATYYTSLTGTRPRVGLLNVGTEPGKGGEALERAAAVLMQLGSDIDFVGSVEGTDLVNGRADVVLCDGFTGNVILKALEGVAEAAAALARDAFARSWLWRAGMLLLSSGLRELRRATDYAEYGGTPILGFPALLIKAHGRSTAHALKNAIRTAVRAANDDLPARLAAALTTAPLPGVRRLGR
jgi:glycerol-3-phosphate acyltransferase PlsX